MQLENLRPSQYLPFSRHDGTSHSEMNQPEPSNNHARREDQEFSHMFSASPADQIYTPQRRSERPPNHETVQNGSHIQSLMNDSDHDWQKNASQNLEASSELNIR